MLNTSTERCPKTAKRLTIPPIIPGLPATEKIIFYGKMYGETFFIITTADSELEKLNKLSFFLAPKINTPKDDKKATTDTIEAAATTDTKKATIDTIEAKVYRGLGPTLESFSITAGCRMTESDGILWFCRAKADEREPAEISISFRENNYLVNGEPFEELFSLI
ncbi:MAG: hypothetical protein PHE24_03045 [Patescibacteria group bacterium]|nr:hypothetical protein [Patescibacteria group bacterium]